MDIRRVGNWVLLRALAILMFVAISLVLMRIDSYERLPLIRGFKPLVTFGNSMVPTIKAGSVVLTTMVEPSQIETGDIITFKTQTGTNGNGDLEEPPTTHRVTRIIAEQDRLSFETRGDANKHPDAYRPDRDDVLGKVILSVPYLGYVSDFIRSPFGILLTIILPGLVLLTVVIGKIRDQIRMIREPLHHW